nr:peptidoglycan-binding domain-containing protein [uncultured Cohaesibacter sp.]
MKHLYLAGLIVCAFAVIMASCHSSIAREDLVVQYLKAENGSDLGLFTVKKVNLEAHGDRSDEYIVSFRGSIYCGTAGCSHEVLQVRNRKVTKLLDIVTHSIDLIEDRSRNGMKGLMLGGSRGDAIWAFDGQEYQHVKNLREQKASPSPSSASSNPASGWGAQPDTRPSPPPNVREIQSALNYLGFCVGPVDGIMGRKTRDAIASFKRNRREWTAKTETSGMITDQFVRVQRRTRAEQGSGSDRCAAMARAVHRGVVGTYIYNSPTATGVLHSLLTLHPNNHFEINARLGPPPEKHVALIRGYYEQQGILVILETRQSDAPTFPPHMALKILDNGDLLSEFSEPYKRLP